MLSKFTTTYDPSISEKMREIFDDAKYGKEIIDDPRRFLALLADKIRIPIKKRELINVALEAGIYKEILIAVQSKRNYEPLILRSIGVLQKKHKKSLEDSQEAINVLLLALCEACPCGYLYYKPTSKFCSYCGKKKEVSA